MDDSDFGVPPARVPGERMKTSSPFDGPVDIRLTATSALSLPCIGGGDFPAPCGAILDVRIREAHAHTILVWSLGAVPGRVARRVVARAITNALRSGKLAAPDGMHAGWLAAAIDRDAGGFFVF